MSDTLTTGEVLCAQGSDRERVEQVHRRCLDSIYATRHYKAVSTRVGKYARHLDFAIGLGTAVSGGSGLGILADPRLAWLCGIATTVSLVLTVAKGVYDWPGRIKKATDMIELYGRISGKYLVLIEEMNYKRAWNAAFETQFLNLRNEESAFNSEDFSALPANIEKAIQNEIKSRIPYAKWWTP